MADGNGLVIRNLGPLVRALSSYFQQPNATIAGANTAAPFGPLQPMRPMFPAGSEPRRFSYQVGQNLNYTPRSGKRYSARDLRELAKYDIVASILETQYDALVSTPWVIRAKLKPGEKNTERTAREKDDPLLAALNRFFEYPDGFTCWADWLRPLLDDLFVLDAPAILVRRSDANTVSRLDVTDGGDIACYVDANGYTPPPPQPAYAQMWNGIPAVNLTTQQLVYKPRNIKSNQLYGRSPVEIGAELIKLGIERLGWQKRFYTDGSIPDAIMIVPPGITPDKIAEQQESITSGLAGNLAARRELRLIQGFAQDGKDQVLFPKDGAALTDVTDDYLIRSLCFLIGVSPQRLLKMQNRSTAEAGQDAAEEEGQRPYRAWIANLINYILRFILGITDYEFAFLQETELDAAKRADADMKDVNSGIITRNEARDARGLDPSPNPMASVLTVTTTTGVVELGAQPDPVDDDEDEPDPAAPGGAGGARPKTKGTSDRRRGAKARKSFPKLHVVTGRIVPENETRERALAALLTTFLADAGKETADYLGKHYKAPAAKVSKSDDETEAAALAAQRERDTETLLEKLRLRWEELRPKVAPILTDAAHTGVATSKTTIQLLRGVTMTVSVENAASTAKSGSSTAAEARAAELVGMKRKADGTYEPTLDARYAISDTTREGIKRKVSQAFEEGWSPDKLADEIQAAYTFSAERAALIAKSEITQAQAEGNMLMWQATGIVTTVRWSLSANHTEEDDDECDSFAEQGEVPLGHEFAPGITRPGAHPRCECGLIVVSMKRDK